MPIPRDKPLSMVVQIACMQERYPQFKYSRPQKAWFGKIKPTDTSPTYNIKLSYDLYSIPRVTVISPLLHFDAPHVYHQDEGSLCLYYSDDKSWTNKRLIAQTILPWTAEWLYYYGLWLATGQWYGPEAPHQGNKTQNNYFLPPCM